MKKLVFTIVFIALLSVAAFADVVVPTNTPKPTASPKQQKSIDAEMRIRLDENAKEATLVIPKNQIQQLRAQLDELDDQTNEPLLSASRTQTIVSGLFLSLAMVFGGVWFSRSRGGRAGKKLVASAVLLFVCAGATIVYANVGPPSVLRSISGRLFDKEVFGGWKRASGKVKVVTSDSGNLIELIVPDKPEEKTE